MKIASATFSKSSGFTNEQITVKAKRSLGTSSSTRASETSKTSSEQYFPPSRSAKYYGSSATPISSSYHSEVHPDDSASQTTSTRKVTTAKASPVTKSSQSNKTQHSMKTCTTAKSKSSLYDGGFEKSQKASSKKSRSFNRPQKPLTSQSEPLNVQASPDGATNSKLYSSRKDKSGNTSLSSIKEDTMILDALPIHISPSSAVGSATTSRDDPDVKDRLVFSSAKGIEVDRNLTPILPTGERFSDVEELHSSSKGKSTLESINASLGSINASLKTFLLVIAIPLRGKRKNKDVKGEGNSSCTEHNRMSDFKWLHTDSGRNVHLSGLPEDANYHVMAVPLPATGRRSE